MIIFEAIREDLSHLGGSMGTEYTTEESLGIFTTEASAIESCRKDYEEEVGGPPFAMDTDLYSVMYHINYRKVK